MTLAPNANAWLRKYAQREASQATIVSIGDSYLPGDEHWNNYGHRWIADVMSQQLRP